MISKPTAELAGEGLVALAVELVAAFARFNRLPPSEISPLLVAVLNALQELTGETGPAPTPAVPVKQSILGDYIICLEDGKKLRTLKRYLMTHYGLTTEAYRKRWGLPFDYPMVAPSYAKLRSDVAKKARLGHKPSARPRK